MTDVFLTPAYAPFAIAFVVMIGIGLIEAIGLGIGQFDLDSDADLHGGTMLDWLGVGAGLPILIWLTALLCCFTLSGVALQQVTTVLTGTPLRWEFASGLALAAAAFFNRFAVAGLTRLMPTFESSAITTDDLLMRRGTVLEGTARRGHPARAKVVDQYQQAHYVMIEPHHEFDVIAQGETALLVRKEGATFYALPDAQTNLRPI
ncbi:MAG TPA: OB-fold-containig protein [Sphingomonas sp.]|nr:OB-fold-containig protein [Sphingomonas sp.]